MKTATRNIKVYKAFTGTNLQANSPYQCFPWSTLQKGKVLAAAYFDYREDICCAGIHGTKLLADAAIAIEHWEGIVWEAIIPKGTLYYQSTSQKSRDRYHSNAKGPTFRAERMILVRQEKKIKEAS